MSPARPLREAPRPLSLGNEHGRPRRKLLRAWAHQQAAAGVAEPGLLGRGAVGGAALRVFSE
eukprot:4131330-Lingulodinium_polyedra.AAC.1